MKIRICKVSSPKEMKTKIIAQFDDGHYTVANDQWVECDENGNLHEKEIKMTEQVRTFPVTGMTWDEAFKKIEALDYDTKEGIDYNLKVLEVLGLIKLDTYRYATNEGDKRFLKFIYDRLHEVFGERKNLDYMLTLKKFVDDWK